MSPAPSAHVTAGRTGVFVSQSTSGNPFTKKAMSNRFAPALARGWNVHSRTAMQRLFAGSSKSKKSIAVGRFSGPHGKEFVVKSISRSALFAETRSAGFESER